MLRHCWQPSRTQSPAGHYAQPAGAQRNTNGQATRLQPLGSGEHGNMAGIAAHLRSAQYNLDEKTGQVVEQFEFPAPELSDAAPPEDRLGGLQERMTLIDLMAYLPGKWSLQPATTSGKHFPIRRSTFSGEGRDTARSDRDRPGTAQSADPDQNSHNQPGEPARMEHRGGLLCEK